MNTQTCIITGGNAGIGKATAIHLAKNDFEVIILARDSQKSIDAKAEIEEQSGGKKIRLITVDLAEKSSILNACEIINSDYSSIDYLINNAGIMKRTLSTNTEGLELTFAVNFLAPFLLSRLLKEKLQSSNNGRITNVSSALYKKGKLPSSVPPDPKKFNGSEAYADSKLLVLLDGMFLSNAYSESNIQVNTMHPGVVGTEVFREYPKWVGSILNLLIMKPEKAAEAVAHISTSHSFDSTSGKYFNFRQTESIKNLDQLLQQYASIESSTRELLGI